MHGVTTGVARSGLMAVARSQKRDGGLHCLGWFSILSPGRRLHLRNCQSDVSGPGQSPSALVSAKLLLISPVPGKLLLFADPFNNRWTLFKAGRLGCFGGPQQGWSSVSCSGALGQESPQPEIIRGLAGSLRSGKMICKRTEIAHEHVSRTAVLAVLGVVSHVSDATINLELQALTLP